MTIQVFDEAATVSYLNRAFNDTSPSNAIFLNQVASAKNSAPTYAAFANAFGASFSGLSNADLSKKVLTNIGVLPTTDTSVAALEQALTDYFAAFGTKTTGANGQVTADTRGFIVLQLATILAGLENATGNQAVYTAAANAWNAEVTASYTYSSNAANTNPSTANSLSSGQTFTLTAGADTFVGTANGDTFNAPAVTSGSSTVESLTAFDNLDGGDGVDTLNASLPTTGLLSVPGGMTIKNIENVVLNATGVAGTAISVNPGASFPGTTNFTLNNANGAITVTSGTAVNVSSGNATSQTVSVSGSALTNVSAKGGTITIDNTSAAGTTSIGTTMTAVTLESIGANAAVKGGAISNLTWKNQTGTFDVALTNATSTSLTLNVDGVGYNGSGSTITNTVTPGAAVTSLTVNATGAKSYPTIANSTATIKTVTLTGSAELNLTAALPTSITKIDGSASTGVIKLDTTGLTSATTISTGTGADTVTLVAATTSGTVALGAGNDKLLGTATLTTPGTIDGGDGTDSVAVALLQNVAAASLGQFKNFEAIDIGSGIVGTLDVSTLSGSTITNLTQSTPLAAAATVVAGLPANTGLTATSQITTLTTTSPAANGLSALPVGTATLNLANAAGASDAMTITFAGTGSDATKLTTDAGTLTLNGIENVTLASGGTATNNTVALVDNSLQTLTITGSVPLYLSQLAATNGAAVGTSDTVNGVKLIDGSAATGKLYLDASALTNIAKAGMTIKGGTAADTIVGTSKGDVIVAGGGADVVTGGGGADKITITGATSTLKITAAADSGSNNATATQTALLTGGLDIVTGAVAGTKIAIGGMGAANAAGVLVSVDVAKTSSSNLATTLQGTDNAVTMVRGTYDAANGIFNYGASGADTALTYDYNGVAAGTDQDFHTIILVGYTPSSTPATFSAATAAAIGTLTLG